MCETALFFIYCFEGFFKPPPCGIHDPFLFVRSFVSRVVDLLYVAFLMYVSFSIFLTIKKRFILHQSMMRMCQVPIVQLMLYTSLAVNYEIYKKVRDITKRAVQTSLWGFQM